jgi:hypothetical protein
MEDREGPEGRKPEAAREGEEKGKQEAPGKEAGFNWRLPLFGAAGFGVGFALRCAIMATMYNLAQNSFADVVPGTGVGPEVGVLRGIIVGAIGGAALGLAFKDKIRAVYFSLAGALGFAVAFALVISIDPGVVPDLGRAIIRLMGGPTTLSMFETALAHGLGAGAIVGAVGGSVLGLASPKGRLVSSLLLGLVGAVSFANTFAFGSTIFEAGLCSSWNGWGGALGGALFGLTLALYERIQGRRSSETTVTAG